MKSMLSLVMGLPGLDSDTLHALSDESLEVLAKLLEHADQGIGPPVGSFPNLWSRLLATADP